MTALWQIYSEKHTVGYNRVTVLETWIGPGFTVYKLRGHGLTNWCFELYFPCENG